jgi:outer membrane lipoprotein SlyB
MKKILLCGPLLLLAACASTPTGPGVMVLPGTGKSFDQFRFDDNECRQYASYTVNGQEPNQAASDAGVRSAAVGTAVGAVAGAALGGSHGAAAGAGIGLAGGALAGTGAANQSSYTLQQRYDIGYQQCMYAKGHQIPMAQSRVARPARAARPYYGPPPPPPPGTPPPPPPPSS